MCVCVCVLLSVCVCMYFVLTLDALFFSRIFYIFLAFVLKDFDKMVRLATGKRSRVSNPGRGQPCKN